MVSAWCQASWLFLRPAVYDDELVVPQSGHKAEEIRAVYSNPADGVIYAAGYLSSRVRNLCFAQFPR